MIWKGISQQVKPDPQLSQLSSGKISAVVTQVNKSSLTPIGPCWNNNSCISAAFRGPTRIAKQFPKITIVIGAHQEHIRPEEFRERVKRLFGQQKKTMVDIILDKDDH